MDNKWIKQKCAHFTMIPFGLEDLGEMTEVSTILTYLQK